MRKLTRQGGSVRVAFLVVLTVLSVFLGTIAIANNTADNTTQNITIDRIVIGQLKVVDFQGDYAFLYFDQGPRIIVTTKLLSLATDGTDPFHYIWTYEFMEAGRFELDNYYYLIHAVGQEG